MERMGCEGGGSGCISTYMVGWCSLFPTYHDTHRKTHIQFHYSITLTHTHTHARACTHAHMYMLLTHYFLHRYTVHVSSSTTYRSTARSDTARPCLPVPSKPTKMRLRWMGISMDRGICIST